MCVLRLQLVNVPHVLGDILLYACPSARSLCTQVAPLCKALHTFVYSHSRVWRELNVDWSPWKKLHCDATTRAALHQFLQQPKVRNGLRNLKLQGNRENSQMVQFFTEPMPNLSTLQLDGCSIGSWQVLLSLARAIPKLKNIKLNSIDFDSSGKRVRLSAENLFWLNLKSVLVDSHVDVALVLFVLQQSCALEVCHLSCSIDHTSQCLSVLVEQHADTLREFVSQCDIGDGSVRQLASCMQLQKLEACCSYVTGDGVSTLSVGCMFAVCEAFAFVHSNWTHPQNLHTAMQHLQLVDISAVASERLVHVFGATDWTQLTYLKLRSKDKSFRSNVVNAIVHSAPQLHTLHLSHIKSLSEQLLCTLVEGLPQLVHLHIASKTAEATIQFTSLESVHWKHLRQFPLLMVCDGLRHLKLRANWENRQTCQFFANALPNLSTLHLDGCSIGSWVVLLCLARATPNLKDIELTGIDFDSSGKRVLLSEENMFWPNLKSVVVKYHVDVDLVLFVLQQSCALEVCHLLCYMQDTSKCVSALVEKHADTLCEFVTEFNIDDQSIRQIASCQRLQKLEACCSHVTADALNTLSVGCMFAVCEAHLSQCNHRGFWW